MYNRIREKIIFPHFAFIFWPCDTNLIIIFALPKQKIYIPYHYDHEHVLDCTLHTLNSFKLLYFSLSGLQRVG